MAEKNKEAIDKPLCFGTYIGEEDLLCSKCNHCLKGECIKLSKRNLF